MRRFLLAAQAAICAAVVLLTGLHPSAAATAVATPAPGHFAAVEPHLVMEMKGPGRSLPEIRDGRTLWAVGKPVAFRTLAGDLITVPAGMTTDLASIPRLVSGALPPDGPWARAALVHDFLYATGGTCVLKQKDLRTSRVFIYPNGCSRRTPYSRAEADEVLRQAMAVLGVSMIQRVTIYEAVRLGGAKGWRH